MTERERLAALREAREETGLELHSAGEAPLDVDVHELPARVGADAHLHLDVRFLLVADADDASGDPEEADGGAWFPRPLALRDTDAGLRRMIEKALPA